MKMKIKSLVEKMGGVQRFTFEPLIPTSRESTSKFLDITKEINCFSFFQRYDRFLESSLLAVDDT